MATFLFVHGAFQGGWVWRGVSDLLQKQGHVVHTPTLSGCGYLFAGSRTGMDLLTYLGDMGEYLEFEELEDIVLVGHSYSGMICGALLMRHGHRIRQAISVDAVIPQSDRSFVEIAGEQFAQMLKQHKMDEALVRPWPVPVFGVDAQRADWFQARLRPFPVAGFTTAFPGRFDPAIRPITHITCLRTMSPFIRAMAGKAGELGWPVLELDAGHCPMITCPETLATMLSTIVQ